MKQLKHIIYFMRWWYQQIDKVLFLMMLGAILFCGGVFVFNFSHLFAKIMIISGVVIELGVFLKLFVYDTIKKAHDRFKKEQYDLFKHLSK